MNKVMKLWKKSLAVQKIFSVLAIAMLLALPFAQTNLVLAATAPSGTLEGNTQVKLCHDNEGASDFSLAQAKVDAIVPASNQGHPPDASHTADIIPPFDYAEFTVGGGPNAVTYPAGHYNGRNWNAAGQALYANDCKAVEQQPTTGTLIVQKSVINDDNGTAATSSFSFKVDGGSAIDFESDGSNQLTGQALGAHTVAEVAAPGYTATYGGACDANGNVTVTTGTVICTITNNDDEPASPTTGSITIDKVVAGEGANADLGFDFEIGWNSTPPELEDLTANDEPVTLDGLAGNDNYTITEADGGENWALTDITCTGEGVSYSENLASSSVTVNLTSGQDITCAFTNTFRMPQEPTATTSISGSKFNDLDGNGMWNGGEPGIEGWTISISDDDSFSTTTMTDSEGDFTFDGLEAGITYYVCEVMQTDWSQTFPVSTSTPNSTDCQGTLGYAVTPAEGQPFTAAYFGNQEDEQGGGGTATGTITIIKESTPEDGTDFLFTINGQEFSLDDGGDEDGVSHQETFERAPGPYTVQEDLKDGWVLADVSCNEGATVSRDPGEYDIEITLGDNEDVTCTFTNRAIGPDEFLLTLELTGDGEGLVVGEGINCDSNAEETDCQETYASGTVVELTVTPDEGSNFDNSWTLGSGTCVGNNTPCSVTMNSNINLVAHFDVDSNSNGGGRRGGGGGGSSSNNDDGEVLGASTTTAPGEVLGVTQIAQLPAGAPNTGAGSTAQNGLYGILLTLAGLYGFARSRKEARI